jgi:hypothetical protein
MRSDAREEIGRVDAGGYRSEEWRKGEGPERVERILRDFDPHLFREDGAFVEAVSRVKEKWDKGQPVPGLDFYNLLTLANKSLLVSAWFESRKGDSWAGLGVIPPLPEPQVQWALIENLNHQEGGGDGRGEGGPVPPTTEGS